MPPVLVLLHAHGVDASIWSGIYADLLPDYSVMTPDFSELTHCTTVEDYANELLAHINSAQADNVVLIGNSMGGYIALAFAEKYPDKVSGLMLYHSTAYADDEAARAQRPAIIQAIEEYGAAPFIESRMPKLVSPSFPAEETAQLVEWYRHLSAPALANGMRAIAARPDRTAILREASFPIGLVLSRDDQVLPYEQTQQLTALNDTLFFETMEHAGYLSMFEQPAASLEIIRAFMSRI